MSREKPVIFEQSNEGDVTVVDFFSQNDDITDSDAKAQALSDALKGDDSAYVTVHRVLGKGNMPEEWCFNVAADKYNFGQLQEYISDTFGGGDYRVRLYSRNRLVKGGNKLITIAQKINLKKEDIVSPTGELSNVLHIVLQQQRQMMEQMSKPQVNHQNIEMDFLNKMLVYKQLFSNSGSSGGIGQITETVELLKGLGMTIGKDEKEEESGFGKFFEMMAPIVANTLQAPKQAPVNNVPPQPQKTAQNEAGKTMIKFYLNTLLNAARKNSDPMSYAEMIFDLAPEETIKQYITNPEAYSTLVKLDARVEQFKEWFLLLAEHMKAQLGMPSSVSDLYAAEEGDISGDSEDSHISE